MLGGSSNAGQSIVGFIGLGLWTWGLIGILKWKNGSGYKDADNVIKKHGEDFNLAYFNSLEKELGEDTDALFTESPFQWSISFALKPEYCDHQAVSFILADLSQKEIVEQTVFNAQAAGTVFARSSMVLTLGLAGATGIFILFLGFLSYVFRAELLQSPTEWFILQTLGAGRGFIAIPHLLFAISACTIGIVIGSGIAQVIRFQYSHSFPWIMEIPLNWLFISLGGITVLCYLTAGFTAISVTKGK